MSDDEGPNDHRRGRRVLLLAAIYFCCGATSASTAGGPAVDFGAVPKLQEQKDRPDAPDFTLVNPGGKKVALKDFRGKVVFLNFWATWCESCRDEMPSMEKLYREFKGQGLEIVGVDRK